jgi:hypothetical protein
MIGIGKHVSRARNSIMVFLALVVVSVASPVHGQQTISSKDVNVVNVPTVTVGNTELQPVPVKGPVKEPVHLEFQLQIVQPFSASNVGSFNVPSGKRLAIEHVSFLCSSDSRKDAFIRLLADGRGLGYVPGQSFATGGDNGALSKALGAGPISTYLDQGALRVSVFRGDSSGSSSDSSGTTNCTVVILGYLTPLP